MDTPILAGRKVSEAEAMFALFLVFSLSSFVSFICPIPILSSLIFSVLKMKEFLIAILLKPDQK